MKNSTTKKTTKKAYTPADDSDDENPIYMFGLTSNALLIGIIKGEIDPVELAKRQLAGRGFGLDNTWIGFTKAEELFNIKNK